MNVKKEESASDENDVEIDMLPPLLIGGPLKVDELERQSSRICVNENTSDESLNRAQVWNLTFCLLAWACIASVTLVVSDSAVIMLSIGGDPDIASVPLGASIFGSALVSLTTTTFVFTKFGRKVGFLLGIAFGMVGTALGAASIAVRSPALLIVCMIFFGMAQGIGFHIRFAAAEVVPPQWAAHAITLVVSGGCIAAFAGPESAQGAKDLFDKEYMGVFLVTGVFYLASAFFIMLIDFPPPPRFEVQIERAKLLSLLRSRHFVVPMLVATICWTCMGMPMSLARVAMNQLGFTSRQLLTVIEMHFLGMYFPGFFTGSMIARYGPPKVAVLSLMTFVIAVVIMMLSESEEDGTIATWYLGLILVGLAWNLGFTAATVWLTRVYEDAPQYKLLLQACNDFLMFALSGGWIVSASYIFTAGGSGLDGWRTVNWTVVAFLVLFTVVLSVNAIMERRTM